jgi:hypothetical protein
MKKCRSVSFFNTGRGFITTGAPENRRNPQHQERAKNPGEKCGKQRVHPQGHLDEDAAEFGANFAPFRGQN